MPKWERRQDTDGAEQSHDRSDEEGDLRRFWSVWHGSRMSALTQNMYRFRPVGC